MPCVKPPGLKFDLIFYSPFTYEFSPEYARLLDWRQAGSSAAKIGALVDGALEGVIPTLDVLSDLFECNVFVHNSANIARHNSKFAEAVKNLLSWLLARMGRKIVASGRLRNETPPHSTISSCSTRQSCSIGMANQSWAGCFTIRISSTPPPWANGWLASIATRFTSTHIW